MSMQITETQTEDYNSVKEYLSAIFSLEYLQQLYEESMPTIEFEISNLQISDYEANIATAFRMEYDLVLPESIIFHEVSYNLYLKNSVINISVSDAEKLDLDTIAQYIINSIVIN